MEVTNKNSIIAAIFQTTSSNTNITRLTRATPGHNEQCAGEYIFIEADLVICDVIVLPI